MHLVPLRRRRASPRRGVLLAPAAASLPLAAAAWVLVSIAPPVLAAEPGGPFAPPLPMPLIVVEAFAPPARPWLPGNRGVDLAANTGDSVFAATDGVVVYAGELAGRGVVSVGRGGLRVSYEPVDPLVRVGEQVERGRLIGRVSGEADACGPPGSCLHWGVRDGATYLDPMKFLARHPPVRLLPIWTNGPPTTSAADATSAADLSAPLDTAPLAPSVLGAPPLPAPALAAPALAAPAAPAASPTTAVASTTPSPSARQGSATRTGLVAGGAVALGGVATLGAATVAVRRSRAQYLRVGGG